MQRGVVLLAEHVAVALLRGEAQAHAGKLGLPRLEVRVAGGRPAVASFNLFKYVFNLQNKNSNKNSTQLFSEFQHSTRNVMNLNRERRTSVLTHDFLKKLYISFLLHTLFFSSQGEPSVEILQSR